MNKIIFIGLMLMATSQFSSAEAIDTLDYWHVYYNGVKIRAYNLLVNEGKEALPYKTISLRLDSIKGYDSVTVLYGSDTPCPVCDIYLSFYDGLHEIVIGSTKSHGLKSPVSFKLKKLVDFEKGRGTKTFEIFYTEIADDKPYRKGSVFIIQLE